MEMKFIAVILVTFFSGVSFQAFAADSHESHHISTQEPQASYSAKGQVVTIDQESSKLKIRHEAIPELSWPAMTMNFNVVDKSQLEGLRVGDKVIFVLVKDKSTGQYVINSLKVE